MPRIPTSNKNAEEAVRLFISEVTDRGWELDEAWLAISRLLMTCEIWDNPRKTWMSYFAQPVLRESNDYKLLSNGTPNQALKEAALIGDYIAQNLNISRQDLCNHLGMYMKALSIQPNNPRGHAFRSVVAEVLAQYGNPNLTIQEEVSPYTLFPGHQFNLRSKNPRIDIVAYRNNLPVALCSTRWTYRHDRVDMLEEARAYMNAARQVNPNICFFGITAEINPARLQKVVSQTLPLTQDADMNRLVHLHAPLATTVINHNGYLTHLMDLADWVRNSHDW